jgi:hypothetical protein
MTISRRTGILLLSGVVVVLVGSYGLWPRRTATPRVLVGRDASDIATLRGSPGQASYDPYFVRVNFTRVVVVSPTNDVNAGTKPH